MNAGGATIQVDASGTAMCQRWWAVLYCTPSYCIEMRKIALVMYCTPP